ncbi:MAG: MTH1187 family thiamine-binding protein [Pseudomonadota bacterium]
MPCTTGAAWPDSGAATGAPINFSYPIEVTQMVVLEFSMSPFDKGESLSKYVARSLDIIDKSGLPYQLTPMGTIVEGEWEQVMAVVTACFETMSQDCNRISTSMKIDYRAGKSGRLKSKIRSIESKLGRTLST